MKRSSATAMALALFLSLGVTLSGCGLLGRTVPNGFYGEPNTGVKIRPTDPYGNVQYHKPYWTIEKDGSMLLGTGYRTRAARGSRRTREA